MMNEVTKNDPAFYVWGGTTVVHQDPKARRFYVACVGEMRIRVNKDSDSDSQVIRYTDDLERFGITNDQQLLEWSNKGEEVFDWINNAWFEIYDEKDSYSSSDPFHDLDEAIEYCKMLNRNGGYLD